MDKKNEKRLLTFREYLEKNGINITAKIAKNIRHMKKRDQAKAWSLRKNRHIVKLVLLSRLRLVSIFLFGNAILNIQQSQNRPQSHFPDIKRDVILLWLAPIYLYPVIFDILTLTMVTWK